jgi:NAD(P)H-nitrite reductase large subunit
MSEPKLYPSNVKPRRRQALRPEDIDKVGQALLTVTQELWALRDRQMVTEEVLKEKGIDISEAIDTHKPSPELEAKLRDARTELVKKVALDLNGEYGLLDQ